MPNSPHFFLLYFVLFLQFHSSFQAFRCWVDQPDGRLAKEVCPLDYCYTLECAGKIERGCTGRNYPFDCPSKEQICKMFHPETKKPECWSCVGELCNKPPKAAATSAILAGGFLTIFSQIFVHIFVFSSTP